MDAEGLGQLPNSGTAAVCNTLPLLRPLIFCGVFNSLPAFSLRYLQVACLIREEAGGKRYLYTGNVGDCR